MLIVAVIFFVADISIGSADLEIVQAKEILYKISDGEDVNYSEVSIAGDLKIDAIDKIDSPTDRIIDSIIRITDSRILGNLSFNDAVFENQVIFNGTEFQGVAIFDKSLFKEPVSFQNALFNESISLRKAQFDRSAHFGYAIFNKSADFSNSLFRGEKSDFKDCQFNDYATFYQTSFDAGSTRFEGSKFEAPAIFFLAHFGGESYFDLSQFKELADFRFVILNKTADFSGARFEKEIDLNDIKFPSLIITWDSIRDKLICRGPTYLALIKNFKDLEQIEDADNCYFQYRDWKREMRPWGWLKLLDYLAWISCGYGVRWHHAILSGILTVLLFGIYFESYSFIKLSYGSFLNRNATGFNRTKVLQRMKRAIGISAMILLSLPSEWYPYGKEEYTRFVAVHLYSAIIERLIGWGLMLLLIGTLSRLMVRY